MAAQEKMMSNTGSDLDSLIHSLEYENQQYVKMIEKENQRNAYLETQEEEKLGVIGDLQIQITNLEGDTKNNHRQLVHNKNTLESLKKSRCVLQAHKDALLKHLNTLQFENNEQCHELEDTVQMYEKTWADYEAQYQSLALYQQLLMEEEGLAQSQAEQRRWQLRKTELLTKIRRAQDELDFRDWRRFCVKIAEKWWAINRKKEELLSAVREKETLQAKLKEIREKNTSSMVIASESAQDMETDSSQMESGEKEAKGGNPSEEDLALVAGDGGDMGEEVEGEKENLDTEQQESDRTDTVVQVSSSHQTTTSQVSDARVPSVVSLSAISPVVMEERMEEDGGKIRETRHVGRFEPSDTSTPVTEVRPTPRRPLQPLQLTPTPRIPYRPPVLTVPKIRMGVYQKHNPSLPVSTPKTTDLPRKVAPATNILQFVSSHSRPTPPQLSVPLISIPRPSPQSSPSQVPTVRSAVMSILSGARSAVEKLPKPSVTLMPRIPLPRMPVLAPPPSPVPSQLSQSSDKGSKSREVLQSEQSGTTRLASGGSVSGVAMVQRQSGVERPQLSDPVSLQPTPAPVNHIPSMLRPPSKQGPMASSESTAALDGRLAAPPELITPGAGDAPPMQQPDKMDLPGGKHGDMPKDSTQLTTQDEEMDSDSESRGASQSSSQLSEGRSSQGQFVAFSPFNLDKHKQKLLEINDDSGDSFNFQQRHLFQSNDKMEDHPSHSTTAASSIFNMAFARSPSAPKEQTVAPLFKDVTSPNTSSPAAPTQPDPVNRDNERSGSFFSFESMDTSEPGGGLSLLSMFGSDKELEPQPAFSFTFGASSADKENALPFSFSFNGAEGGDKEGAPSSVFSLF